MAARLQAKHSPITSSFGTHLEGLEGSEDFIPPEHEIFLTKSVSDEFFKRLGFDTITTIRTKDMEVPRVAVNEVGFG